MLSKLFKHLNIEHIGFLELILSLYIILSGYSYGSFRFDSITLLLLDLLAFIRCRKILIYKPVIWLIVLIFFHEIFLMFYLGQIASNHVNSLITGLISLSSILFITPAVKFDKFLSSLFIVAIISSLGILYHYILIQYGIEVHPLKLPFMPDLSQDSRFFEYGNRPVSFYWEPSSYITFMMLPLFITLWQKKYTYAFILILFIFLSTSTNGIIFSIIMLAVYVMSQKIDFKYRLLVVLLGITSVFYLLNSNVFVSSIDKINSTEIEETARLINGPLLIANMPLEHILFGFPTVNATDYLHTSWLIGIPFAATSTGLYLPSIWLILSKYGIGAFFIYLYIYFDLFKKSRQIFPFLIVLFLASFVQSVSLSGKFAFQMIFLFSFIKYIKQERV